MTDLEAHVERTKREATHAQPVQPSVEPLVIEPIVVEDIEPEVKKIRRVVKNDDST